MPSVLSFSFSLFLWTLHNIYIFQKPGTPSYFASIKTCSIISTEMLKSMNKAGEVPEQQRGRNRRKGITGHRELKEEGGKEHMQCTHTNTHTTLCSQFLSLKLLSLPHCYQTETEAGSATLHLCSFTRVS